jgi:hypothetical protein
LYDFLDALVSLGFLQRRGYNSTAVYSYSTDTDLFLGKSKITYVQGCLKWQITGCIPSGITLGMNPDEKLQDIKGKKMKAGVLNYHRSLHLRNQRFGPVCYYISA